MVDTPVIRVCPDDNGNVTTESFKIIKSGKFTGNGYVQVSCDYMDDLGNVYVHDCYVAKVSVEKGVEFIYYYKDVAEMSSIPVMNKKKLKYKKTDYKTPITLGVAYPLDVEICDEIHNILIF